VKKAIEARVQIGQNVVAMHQSYLKEKLDRPNVAATDGSITESSRDVLVVPNCSTEVAATTRPIRWLT